jgi:hypothetical protein
MPFGNHKMSPKQYSLAPNEAQYFLGQFRNARAVALSDAEGYQELLFCIERLGTALTGQIATLGSYRGAIIGFAGHSALTEDIPNQWRDLHIPLSRLYEMVMHARNDALHQGAFARNLTAHAIQLALALEDALMSEMTTVADYMVRDPICAQAWHPISFIRQQMLASSFSFLPVLYSRDGISTWCLISDHELAMYLAKRETRKQRLATRLDVAGAAGAVRLEEAKLCFVDEPIEEALRKFSGSPLLVCHRQYPDQIVGIITAFDLL